MPRVDYIITEKKSWSLELGIEVDYDDLLQIQECPL
jgi:hypothetical protein